MLKEDGKLEKAVLGRGDGQQLQVNVSADTYMAFQVCQEGEDDFCLCTCVAAPAYDFMEDIAPKREELLKKFPQHEELVKKFTRDE